MPSNSPFKVSAVKREVMARLNLKGKRCALCIMAHASSLYLRVLFIYRETGFVARLIDFLCYSQLFANNVLASISRSCFLIPRTVQITSLDNPYSTWTWYISWKHRNQIEWWYSHDKIIAISCHLHHSKPPHRPQFTPKTLFCSFYSKHLWPYPD